MSRGAPPALSSLRVPARAVRAAQRAQCPDCHDVVPTRNGLIAGHYAAGTELCSGSSTPVPSDTRPAGGSA